MKLSQLRNIISSVIKEELEKQLPSLITKVLAENYLKSVLIKETQNNNNNQYQQRKAKDRFIETPTKKDKMSDFKRIMLERCDDEIEQDDGENQEEYQGQYVTEKIERNNPLLDESTNPLAFIYKDVTPVSSIKQNAQPTAGTDVDISALGLDFNKINKTVKLMEKKSFQNAPVPQRKRIMNEELDKVVSTGEIRQQNNTPVKRPQTSLISNVDDGYFPDKPLQFDVINEN